MSGSAAQVRQLEKRIENIFQDDNNPVFVLVIGVNEKSYCLIDGKEVYSGPEFERAKRRWEENQGPIEVIEGLPARGISEDRL